MQPADAIPNSIVAAKNNGNQSPPKIQGVKRFIGKGIGEKKIFASKKDSRHWASEVWISAN